MIPVASPDRPLLLHGRGFVLVKKKTTSFEIAVRFR